MRAVSWPVSSLARCLPRAQAGRDELGVAGATAGIDRGAVTMAPVASPGRSPSGPPTSARSSSTANRPARPGRRIGRHPRPGRPVLERRRPDGPADRDRRAPEPRRCEALGTGRRPDAEVCHRRELVLAGPGDRLGMFATTGMRSSCRPRPSPDAGVVAGGSDSPPFREQVQHAEGCALALRGVNGHGRFVVRQRGRSRAEPFPQVSWDGFEAAAWYEAPADFVTHVGVGPDVNAMNAPLGRHSAGCDLRGSTDG